MKQEEAPALVLVKEAGIHSLLGGAGKKRFEASGVCREGGYLHIVFDNKPRLLRIRPDWDTAREEPVMLDLAGTAGGYEDIAYLPSSGRWYCLIEAAETATGEILPHVDEFDRSFAFVRSFSLPFPLSAGNKGFEGITALHAGRDDYLICLCEGNDCRGGGAGRKPGKGRIQVFRQAHGGWEQTGTIRLPEAVRFRDYAGLDLRDNRLAVVSQESSALWTGRLRAGPGGPKDRPDDGGRVFLFPRDDQGRVLYGNAEGVAWLGDDLLAVVSDRVKDGQPDRCADKDQSVHIFRLPPGS